MNKPQIILGSGISSHKEYGRFLQVVRCAVENGCTSFDTAPSYRTEGVLGTAIKQCQNDYNLSRGHFFVQTKIDAWQMQETNGSVEKHVVTALGKMGMDFFDSLLIHWPIPEYLEKTWKSLCAMKDRGLLKTIGVCNVRERHLIDFERMGIFPDSIQIERHPLMVFEKEVGLAQKRGVIVQAYSPLCKMHPRLGGSSLLQKIAGKYSKSVGQIILRWHIDTGVIPVFTSTKVSRVEEYLKIFDFSLSEEDVCAVSSLNENYKLCLESYACPGF